MARRKQPSAPTPPRGVSVPATPPVPTTALVTSTPARSSAPAPAPLPAPSDASKKEDTAAFVFPTLVNALGIVGVVAVSVVPLAMAVTARQLDMLYHLGFSATWYVTSLLPVPSCWPASARSCWGGRPWEASGFRPHRGDRRRWAEGEQWPEWLGSLEQRAHLSPALLEEAALVGKRDSFIEVGTRAQMIT